MTVDGKKEFLKKSCLTLKEEIISTYLVKYELLDTGITLRMCVRDFLLRIL